MVRHRSRSRNSSTTSIQFKANQMQNQSHAHQCRTYDRSIFVYRDFNHTAPSHCSICPLAQCGAGPTPDRSPVSERGREKSQAASGKLRGSKSHLETGAMVVKYLRKAQILTRKRSRAKGRTERRRRRRRAPEPKGKEYAYRKAGTLLLV